MYKKKEFISKEINYINNLINFSKKILLNFRLIILFNIMKIFNRVLLVSIYRKHQIISQYQEHFF